MKVIGYGDNVVDRYVNKGLYFPGGNCINFAVYAKQIGIPSAYLGMFGEDKEAEHLQNTLKNLNVDIRMCQTEKGSVTERCDVDLIDGDRIFREDDSRENLHGSLSLSDKELKYLAKFDLIHCSCYAEEEDEIPKLKGLNSLITYDFSNDEEYREDSYLQAICPYIDFALFSCEGMQDQEIDALLKKVHGLGTQYVLATMGIHGQRLYDGNMFYAGKVNLLEAVDTMGAGDSFFTAFLMSLLKSGWKKGTFLNKESISNAFGFAAQFSANNCLVHGAFGFEKEMKDEKEERT
jgi:sugar/nucleoside kinase (ribokinase family)